MAVVRIHRTVLVSLVRIRPCCDEKQPTTELDQGQKRPLKEIEGSNVEEQWTYEKKAVWKEYQTQTRSITHLK